MQSFLTPVLFTIHLMLSIALVGVVLLQRSEGGLGGLGGGGMSGFMTTRGSTNLLTKTTRWLAAGFMATSLVIAWLGSHPSVAPSIIGQPPASSTPYVPPAAPASQSGPEQPATGAPASAGGATGTAPATPTTPAVPTNQ